MLMGLTVCKYPKTSFVYCFECFSLQAMRYFGQSGEYTARKLGGEVQVGHGLEKLG